jgi:mannose-6-phosphate isomerase-like protein (cupin superfamily)
MNAPYRSHKLALFEERFSPRVVATMNDYKIEVVKVEGEFVWHSHPDTDDFFHVLKGELEIEFRDRTVQLRQGDLFVVPPGLEHRPRARDEAHILLIGSRKELREVTGCEFGELPPVGGLFGLPLIFDQDLLSEQRALLQRRLTYGIDGGEAACSRGVGTTDPLLTASEFRRS